MSYILWYNGIGMDFDFWLLTNITVCEGIL